MYVYLQNYTMSVIIILLKNVTVTAVTLGFASWFAIPSASLSVFSYHYDTFPCVIGKTEVKTSCMLVIIGSAYCWISNIHVQINATLRVYINIIVIHYMIEIYLLATVAFSACLRHAL